jgi:hypothetical protein
LGKAAPFTQEADSGRFTEKLAVHESVRRQMEDEAEPPGGADRAGVVEGLRAEGRPDVADLAPEA